MQNYGIHWFRRDLRVNGNRALQYNWKENKGRVLGLFCFDKSFLSRDDFSINRFQVFLNALKNLQVELRERGSDLLVLDIGPQKSFKELLDKFKEEKKLPSLITFNRDYEPFARKRDQEMSKVFDDFEIPFETFRDHLIIEPEELYRDKPENGYKVFTPFSRKWLSLFQLPEIQERIKQQESYEVFFKNKPKKIFSLSWEELLEEKIEDLLETYHKENLKKVDVDIPDCSSKLAYLYLQEFKKQIDHYSDKRDIPSIKGTSKLSMFFKNGTITNSQVINYLGLDFYEKGDKSGRAVFFSELIWREFYYHVLYRNPEVETESFIPKFKKLKWKNNEKWFDLWKKGETGFPIVDAGMRELNQTGWMHNRVRMIVASFLIKDLHIDWRWGERYFMEKLLDGDLAPNNGGWQWAASTGCDAQPYFRIFNPWSQSKRFDPKGEYIRKFIPELESVSDKELHKPILGHKRYPEPMIEHSVQRLETLEMYKSV